jgi:hypothetical protein
LAEIDALLIAAHRAHLRRRGVTDKTLRTMEEMGA